MKSHYELSYVIVDDDEDDRMLMRMALERTNRMLPIFEFSDGRELIDYLAQDASSRLDKDMHWLVVMDINMPRLNGLDAIKQLRQDPGWAKLPVLMLSTSDDPAMARESLARGANGYIVKPQTINGFTQIFDQYFAPWLALESSQWPTQSSMEPVNKFE